MILVRLVGLSGLVKNNGLTIFLNPTNLFNLKLT